MTWTRTVSVARRPIPLRGFAVFATMIGPLVVSSVLLDLSAPQSKSASVSEWAAIGGFLRDYALKTGTNAGKPRILLTYILKGPEIAWRTPYSVVGAPYANLAALRDTNAILRAKTDADARRIIDRRKIELLLYCKEERENKPYRSQSSSTLLTRIEQGKPPAWLVPVALPGTLSRQFRLYRIAHGGGAT